MAILTTIIGAITGQFATGLVKEITGIANAYINKKVTEAELQAKVNEAVLRTFADVEKAWLDAATKQFEAFQETVRSTPIIQRAYAAVIVTQLFVLVWYQWGASAFLLFTGKVWPSAGTTVDWAYAILALCLGGGAFVFKGGSGIGEVVKGVLGRKS